MNIGCECCERPEELFTVPACYMGGVHARLCTQCQTIVDTKLFESELWAKVVENRSDRDFYDSAAMSGANTKEQMRQCYETERLLGLECGKFILALIAETKEAKGQKP